MIYLLPYAVKCIRQWKIMLGGNFTTDFLNVKFYLYKNCIKLKTLHQLGGEAVNEVAAKIIRINFPLKIFK